MRVISRKALVDAAAKHPDLAGPLETWYRIAKQAEWANLNEIRQTWANADLVGSCTVFNIKGNHYRLIAWISFKSKKIFIRQVLTHAEYSKEEWKNECFG